MTTYPSSPPSLPVSKTPNYFASTSTPGATLTGKSLRYNQLTAKAGNVTLVGGTLSDIFILNDPSDVVVWKGGVDTVEIAGSYTLPNGIDNLYLLGSANATATGNSGNNIIIGNAGTDVLVTGGGNDILKGGTGPDTYVVTPQANTTTWIENFKTTSDKIDLTGYGFISFAAVQAAMVQSGTNVALNLGNGELVMVQGKQLSSFTASNFRGLPTYPTAPPSLPVSGAPNNWLSTWTPGATLTGDPTKNNQLSANATGVTLVGGPGNDTFVAYDPWTAVVANGGIDTVETWGSGYTLPAGIDNLTLEGSNNAFATGNSGNNIITGNAGIDILTTGGGNDILIAGTGADTFVLTPQAKTTTWIEGFKTSGAAVDTLNLSGYGFASFAAVQAAMVQSGSNVAINLGNGQLVMLQNQQVSNITAGNVTLTAPPTAPPPTFPAAPPSLPVSGASNNCSRPGRPAPRSPALPDSTTSSRRTRPM